MEFAWPSPAGAAERHSSSRMRKSLALSITAAPNLFTLKQWNAAGLKIELEQKEKGEKEEERSGILEF